MIIHPGMFGFNEYVLLYERRRNGHVLPRRIPPMTIGSFFRIIVESFSCINAGLTSVELLSDELSDFIGKRSFDLCVGLHLIDRVDCVKSDNIDDLERAFRSAGSQLPCEIDRLRIRDLVRPQLLCGIKEWYEHGVQDISGLLFVELQRNHADLGGELNDLDKNLKETAEKTVKAYEVLSDDLKVTESYGAVMDLVSAANKYIEESAPWALAKDPAKAEELASCMSHLANAIFVAGMLLSPILVTKSEKIFDQLGVDASMRNYETATKFGVLGGQKVVKGDQLFPRLDVEAEVQFIKDLMAAPKEKAAA